MQHISSCEKDPLQLLFEPSKGSSRNLALRGAPLSDKERKELNLKAGRLIKSRGIYMDVKDGEYDELREEYGFVGYAHYYLQECWNESELKNKADVTIYKQLLEIDAKLGTTQTEQLFWCVFSSIRIDWIKV